MKKKTQIRYPTLDDLRLISQYERKKYAGEFSGLLITPKVFIHSAYCDNLFVGYSIFSIETNGFNLLRCEVFNKHRLNGHGEALIRAVKARLRVQSRRKVFLRVNYDDLKAQLFLKKFDFVAFPEKNRIYFEYSV